MEFREFRSAVEEKSGKLSGVAAPFGSETVIGDLSRGGWREEIAPGAFKKTLAEGDTVLLCDHDMSKPLARTSAGTLRLSESDTALEFDADPVDTTYSRDLQLNIKARNKGGMSIGFNPVKDDWYDDAGNVSNRSVGTKRIIREVKLPEVSCVTNPAYKDTAVFARDDSAALLEERAAKASYADLETCGECGATGQYGSFCSGCGKSMKQDKPSGAYCSSCGNKINGKRSEHECPEERENPEAEAPRDDETSGDSRDSQEPESSTPDFDTSEPALTARMVATAADMDDFSLVQQVSRASVDAESPNSTSNTESGGQS